MWVASVKAIIVESARHLRQRFRLRALEWQNACITGGWGTMILATPSQFAAQSYSGFIGSAQMWGGAFLVVSLLSFGALIINGTVPRPTAMLRTIAAAAQVFLYLLLAIGFAVSGTGTPGITTYGFLALYGFFGGIWALFDAVNPEYDAR